MKILSLFDGMACGALAMQAAGIKIEKYIAYEVDKYAIQTAQHNFPFIEERGDVFKADFTEYAGFDYLIGGSPCTYWSIAQTKNRETVASGMGWELFSQYVRALHEAKPRFFLYENNKSMSAAIRASITETFGFEPILINSALVSAQNRQRLYWCGIRQADGTYKKADIQQPADRGILLKDILETNGTTWLEKSHTITATESKGSSLQHCLEKHVRKQIFEPINAMKYELKSVENKDAGIIGILDMAGQEQIKRVYGTNGKCATLTTCQGGHREPKVFEKIAEPICVNSKSGRAGVEGLQPSLQDRVYDTAGKMPAVTSSFNPKIAEPIKLGENGKGSQGNRVYSIDGKAVAQTAQSGGMGSNTGLYAEPVNIESNKCVSEGIKKIVEKKGYLPEMINPYNKSEIKTKAPTLSTGSMVTSSCAILKCEKIEGGVINAPIYEVKDGYITIKGKQYPIKLVDGLYIIRKLTVRECMRLQTVPEWYEWPVSKSQAYKMLGNGWTVEVIAHLLRGCTPRNQQE